MTDWAFLKHDVTGGTTFVPNELDVLADYAARGWNPSAEPNADIYIPAPDGLGPRTDLDPSLYLPQVVSDNPDDTISPDGAED